MRWLRVVLMGVVGIVPWIVAVFGIGWLVERHMPANGQMVIDMPLTGRSPWFEAFLPGQRASSPGMQPEGWVGQRITDDPVYARLRLPGAYERATVEVEFRPHGQPLIELGIERGNEPTNSYEMVPLWSRELAASGFVSSTVEGISWLVDPRLGEQATHSGQEGRASWYASGTLPTAWMDQGPVSSTRVQVSLRGQHDWWFVPVDGAMAFSALMQDMNRSRATASAGWRLMNDKQELVWSDAINFGGRDDATPSELVERRYTFRDLAPGVYRLSLLADDSIFLREWSIGAKRWVIGPRVYFADEVGYATSTAARQAWTNSTHIEAKTLHKEGLQTLSLGTATTTLVATHTTYPLSRTSSERQGPALFTAPRGNVWLLGNAYTSWSKDALFFPTIQRFTEYTRLEEEGIRAVATTYQSPEVLDDGWYRAQTTFALDPRLDRAKLVLAAPGVARRGEKVDIRRVLVRYERAPRRESWWQALRAELSRAWNRW